MSKPLFTVTRRGCEVTVELGAFDYEWARTRCGEIATEESRSWEYRRNDINLTLAPRRAPQQFFHAVCRNGPGGIWWIAPNSGSNAICSTEAGAKFLAKNTEEMLAKFFEGMATVERKLPTLTKQQFLRGVCWDTEDAESVWKRVVGDGDVADLTALTQTPVYITAPHISHVLALFIDYCQDNEHRQRLTSIDRFVSEKYDLVVAIENAIDDIDNPPPPHEHIWDKPTASVTDNGTNDDTSFLGVSPDARIRLDLDAREAALVKLMVGHLKPGSVLEKEATSVYDALSMLKIGKLVDKLGLPPMWVFPKTTECPEELR